MKNQQDREESMDSMMSPSFSSYTSDKLADIADRVNRDYFRSLEPRDNGFEFISFRKVADGVFLDGCEGPVFPVFNRDLLTLYESDGGNGRVRDSSAEEDHVMAVQFPMRNLMIHDDNNPPSSSSSSSGVDDLEEIPPGSYCVWTPNPAKASPSRHKKTNSAGSPPSSKRWKLMDLLRRSNSDGKDSFVFVTPTSSGHNLEKKKELRGENSKTKKKVSAHEALYTRNKELNKLNKRRSYLPYRQELIGFGLSVNGLVRALRTF